MKLVDLIEWRFDHVRKCFIKTATHNRGVPPAIAHANKKALEQRSSLHTRFTTPPHGTYNNINKFKYHGKKAVKT